MVCRQIQAHPLRQSYWVGSACRHERDHHALCLRDRPVPVYFVLQVCFDRRPSWMNPCLLSRLFVPVRDSAWMHLLLDFLFWRSQFPLVLACGSCRSWLFVGNFPVCRRSARSCPHACLGSYSHVRFDCCSSDPPGLYFPSLVAGHLVACLFSRKQPLLRPVYVSFSRKSGIDWH